MILDLDQFKQLNDTLGHYAGDILLRQIGPRASGVLRPVDMLARLGGDEFGILLAAPCGEHDALRIAERINDACASRSRSRACTCTSRRASASRSSRRTPRMCGS